MGKRTPKRANLENVNPDTIPRTFQNRFRDELRMLKYVVDKGENKVGPDHSSWNVLIYGPTGVGKEVLAQLAAHHLGRSLVLIDCSHLREATSVSQLFGAKKGSATGLDDLSPAVEAAADGILFLDEIGKAGNEARAPLLRFLADRSFARFGEAKHRRNVANCVVIATTQDKTGLSKEMPDLLGRCGQHWHVPPLSRRRDEIPEWIASWLSAYDIAKVQDEFVLECICVDPLDNLRGLRRTVENRAILFLVHGMHDILSVEGLDWLLENVVECSNLDARRRDLRLRIRALMAKDRTEGERGELKKLASEHETVVLELTELKLSQRVGEGIRLIPVENLAAEGSQLVSEAEKRVSLMRSPKSPEQAVKLPLPGIAARALSVAPRHPKRGSVDEKAAPSLRGPKAVEQDFNCSLEDFKKRAAERFWKHWACRKKDQQLTNKELASVIGVCEKTVRENLKRHKPG